MKHTLEVPLLPDGWKPVRVGYVEPGEWYLCSDWNPLKWELPHSTMGICLVVEKVEAPWEDTVKCLHSLANSFEKKEMVTTGQWSWANHIITILDPKRIWE
jgi:hypothetical protein